MPAPTLLRLAQKACVAYIRHIDNFGELPYSVLRPILLKVDSAHQLRTIEENSPQICGFDAEIWQGLIRRDITNWEDKLWAPKNPNNWWKVYRKLKRELEDEMKGQEAALKAALDERKTEKESHRITIVNKIMVPRKRISRLPGYSSRSLSGQGSRVTFNPGKSPMEAVRQQARDASMMTAGKGALATPTHLLASKAKQGSSSQVSSGLMTSETKKDFFHQELPKTNAANATAKPAPKRIIGSKRLPPSVFVAPRKRMRI